MAEDGIKVIGLNELMSSFNKLKTQTAEKVVRKSLRKGGRLMQDALTDATPVRPNLPSGTALPPGAMASDIQLSVTKTSEGIVATIGPGKHTAPFAIMVEYGHRQVKGGYSKLIKSGRNAGKTRGPGKETGMVPAHPFVRPCYEANVDSVTTAIIDSLTEGIVQAVANPDNIQEE